MRMIINLLLNKDESTIVLIHPNTLDSETEFVYSYEEEIVPLSFPETCQAVEYMLDTESLASTSVTTYCLSRR